MNYFIVGYLIILVFALIIERLTKYQNNRLLDNEIDTNAITAEIYKKEVLEDNFLINLARVYLFNLPKNKILRTVYTFEINNETYWGFEWVKINSKNEELIYRILRSEKLDIIYLKNDYSVSKIER